MDISINYIDSKKYVALDKIAEFLEYKRINIFISNIKKKATTIIQDILIEVSELLKLIRKNVKEKVSELYDILLKEEDKEEIREIIDKFNEVTNEEYAWIEKNEYFAYKDRTLWYLISALNIGIVNNNFIKKYLSIFKTSISELENIFIYGIGYMPYTFEDEENNIREVEAFNILKNQQNY